MSFENFWVYTEQVFSEHMDIGFEPFSKGHLIWLSVLAIAMLAVVAVYKRSSDKTQAGIRKAFGLGLLIMETVKDIIIVAVGAPLSAYLPLHLCGYALFFVLIDAFAPKQKVTGQLMAYAFGPGALSALLFPGWAMLPLFWNFLTIHSFIFHWGIVTYTVMRLAAGEIRPDHKGIWMSFFTMAILAVPAYLVDMKYGYNYMFIYKVQRNSPLEIAWNILGTRFGRPGYIAGEMILVIVIFYALYLIYGICGCRRRKR